MTNRISPEDRKLIIQFNQLRETKGYTLGQVEKITGITRGSLSKVSNQKINPNQRTLEKIAYFCFKKSQN